MIGLPCDVVSEVMAFLRFQEAERLCRTNRGFFRNHFDRVSQQRLRAVRLIARVMRRRMPEMTFVDQDAVGLLTRRGHALLAAYWYPVRLRENFLRLTSIKSYDARHRGKATEILARGGPFTKQDMMDVTLSAQTVGAIAFVGW